MPVREGKAAGRRRRRTPEAARREIIEAAEALLRERPFRELTVDEIMRRTELSRPSFYVYFKDRHDLVLRVVEHLGEELLAMANVWLEGRQNGPSSLRTALEGLVDVYGRHAPVLRALADAAVDDRDVEQAYGALVQGFVEVTARRIEDEADSGTIASLDAGETAKALVWMGERYLYHSFGPNRPVAPKTIAATLHLVYSRTLYQAS